ncbi:MAG: DUF3108 domain-containing protein [Gammaproteobacteria bacterium]|nr:DUF3108 domain-containing protein [Gammaproteobacteria bacterium]
MKLAISAILFLYASALFAVEDVPLFEARYNLYAIGIKLGEVKRKLSKAEDGLYLLHSTSHTTGVISLFRDDRIEETSLWRVQGKNIQPLTYAYHHEGSKKQKHEEIRFDWENKAAKSTRKGRTKEISLKDGTLDMAVYQIALMRDLAQGKRDITYTIAAKGKLKNYRLVFKGEEHLDTELGKLKVLKFKRLGKNKARTTKLWCAPSLRYLPVRVEHKEPGGDKISMEIVSLKGITVKSQESE